MSVTLPPVVLTAGTVSTVQLANAGTVEALILSNKSSYDLIVQGLDEAGGRWQAAGTEALYHAQGSNRGVLSITTVNTAQLTNPPAAIALLTVYNVGDKLPLGSWPVTIPTQSVTVTAMTSANSIVNDGNPAGTSIVESTQVGAPGSNVILNNDGTFSLAQYTGGVRTLLLQVKPGAAIPLLLGMPGEYIEVLGSLKVDQLTQLLQTLTVNAPIVVTGTASLDNGTITTDGAGDITAVKNITAVGTVSNTGPISASTTLTAGGDITTTAGNLATTAGDVALGVSGVNGGHIKVAGTTIIDSNGFDLFIKPRGSTNAVHIQINNIDILRVGSGGVDAPNGVNFNIGRIKDINTFSGTGSGTFNHGLSGTPADCWVTTNVNGSTQTVGASNFTATQVTINVGSGLAWRATAYR